jgi:PII-like signaling protein
MLIGYGIAGARVLKCRARQGCGSEKKYRIIFIENLVSKIPELIHYIAKQQTRYLKQSKENLQSDKCIILADCTENYSFILQDAI